MLAIYQDKVEKDVCYETLSEDEPTVTSSKHGCKTFLILSRKKDNVN